MPIRDPKTRSEWQAAVDAAEACLQIESARLYGLIVGGPTIHVHRCEEILAAGRTRQIFPRATGVDAAVQGLIAGYGRHDHESE
jgi:hypothetical protein